MDYSIAFFLPNNTTYDTVRRVLQRMGYEYPVYAKSTYDAVRTAKALLPQGLHMVVSHGLTLRFLERDLPMIPTLELPFSGLDALLAVQNALQYADRRIVHLGTKHLYHYIRRSLQILGVDPAVISFRELSTDVPQEQMAQDLIDEGFEVFIGGFPIVNYVRRRGKVGLEFDVDEQNVEETVLNARRILRNIIDIEERSDLNEAILQASSDGIIALNESRRITSANAAACEILQESEENLAGRLLATVLASHNLIDIELLPQQRSVASSLTPIILRELPIITESLPKGSVVSIKKVSEVRELEYRARRQELAARGLVAKYTFDDILGSSPAIRRAKELAETYAKCESPILLYGDTGTGKELFAHSIHQASSRRSKPFVAINCAALSESLIESELFGYVKGAFTGAAREGKEGLFEIADTGTLFLDEISELPISVQAKLLRVLQEGEIIRVGGDKVIRVDTRIICSSNKDLLQLMRANKFKNDLYYRLSVLEVTIPPLRARPEDIPDLSMSLAKSHAAKHRKKIKSISPDVLAALSRMPLRGNVRELSSILERMVILAAGPVLDMETLWRCNLREMPLDPPEAGEAPQESLSLNIKESQRQLILQALEQCGGNKAATAKLLGVDISTLYRKLKAYHIPH